MAETARVLITHLTDHSQYTEIGGPDIVAVERSITELMRVYLRLEEHENSMYDGCWG